jgi:hypothetical protein
LGKALWKQSAFLSKKVIKMIAFLDNRKSKRNAFVKDLTSHSKLVVLFCYDFVTRSAV